MKTKCPYCKYIADSHETMEKQKNPKDNDISFCIKCGEFSLFKKQGYRPIALVKADLNSFNDKTKEEINDIRIAWLKTNAIRNSK